MNEMNGHRWGAEGPPPEAYSRVTNPKRFAPLHTAAEELLDRLEHEFDTERTRGYGLDPELEEGFKLVRPSVSLVPRDTGAAPIVVAFSALPGSEYASAAGTCWLSRPVDAMRATKRPKAKSSV